MTQYQQLSDHLPILVTLPLKKQHIHILSWNIMGLGVANDIGVDDSIPVGSEESTRYERIVEFLVAQTNDRDHPVDILLLQEASGDEMLRLLKKSAIVNPFAEDWTILMSSDKTMISIIRQQKFPVTDGSYNYDEEQKTQSFILTLNKSKNTQLQIFHVWGTYSFNPANHEAYYKTLLCNKTTDTALVIGDTNSRVLPLDYSSGALVATGVVPTAFKTFYQNVDGHLISDHPDGAFVSIQGQDIRQLPHTPLISFKDMVGTERMVSETVKQHYRPFITLDPHFQALKQTKPYQSFFKAIQDLKQYDSTHPDANFNGMLAANSEGKIGVALCFSSNRDGAWYTNLANSDLKNSAGITFWGHQDTSRMKGTDNNTLRFCTASPDMVPKLTAALLDSLEYHNTHVNKAIGAIDHQIKYLNKRWLFLFSSEEKINALQALQGHINSIKPVMDFPTRVQIKDNIRLWKKMHLAGKTTTHEDVINRPRNPFRFNQPTTKVSSAIFLADLEAGEGPKMK